MNLASPKHNGITERARRKLESPFVGTAGWVRHIDTSQRRSWRWTKIVMTSNKDATFVWFLCYTPWCSYAISVVHLTLDGVNGKWRWRRNSCQIDGEISKLRRQSSEFSDGKRRYLWSLFTVPFLNDAVCAQHCMLYTVIFLCSTPWCCGVPTLYTRKAFGREAFGRKCLYPVHDPVYLEVCLLKGPYLHRVHAYMYVHTVNPTCIYFRTRSHNIRLLWAGLARIVVSQDCS